MPFPRVVLYYFLDVDYQGLGGYFCLAIYLCIVWCGMDQLESILFDKHLHFLFSEYGGLANRNGFWKIEL